jgi:hypothetical protein
VHIETVIFAISFEEIEESTHLPIKWNSPTQKVAVVQLELTRLKVSIFSFFVSFSSPISPFPLITYKKKKEKKKEEERKKKRDERKRR